VASNDNVVITLDLPAWGAGNRIKVLKSRDFNNRNRFIGAVFDETEAGITGVDLAVAESDTLVLLFIITVI